MAKKKTVTVNEVREARNRDIITHMYPIKRPNREPAYQYLMKKHGCSRITILKVLANHKKGGAK